MVSCLQCSFLASVQSMRCFLSWWWDVSRDLHVSTTILHPNLFLWVHLSWYGKCIHSKLMAADNSVQGISDFDDFQVKSKQIGLKSFPPSESWVLGCAQSGQSANHSSSWSPNLLTTGEWVSLRFCFISGRFWYPEETVVFCCWIFFPGYSERIIFLIATR